MVGDWTGWGDALDEIKEENKEKAIKKCICEIKRMVAYGCKCGAIEEERKNAKEQKEEIRRIKRKALNEGISYEERCKKWGTDSEF